MYFVKFLGFTTTIILLINVILYLKAFFFQDKAFKVFFYYLFVICVIQITNNILGPILHLENLFLSNIYLVGQFLFLSVFYAILLNSYKIILSILTVIFIGLIFQYIINTDLFFRYNPIGITITQFSLIIYSVTYLYRSLNLVNSEFLIVNIGLFLYLVSSTLIFASGNLVFNIDIPTKTYDLLFILNAIFYFIFQILIFIEWRKNYYKKTRRS